MSRMQHLLPIRSSSSSEPVIKPNYGSPTVSTFSKLAWCGHPSSATQRGRDWLLPPMTPQDFARLAMRSCSQSESHHLSIPSRRCSLDCKRRRPDKHYSTADKKQARCTSTNGKFDGYRISVRSSSITIFGWSRMPDIFVALPQQWASGVSLAARTRHVQTAHSPAKCSIGISELLKTLNGREQHIALVCMWRTERCMFKLL